MKKKKIQVERKFVHTREEPKIMRIFFLEERGALVPFAAVWWVYSTARRISWPSGVLEERSIGSV
jgi:hypothetical protein